MMHDAEHLIRSHSNVDNNHASSSSNSSTSPSASNGTNDMMSTVTKGFSHSHPIHQHSGDLFISKPVISLKTFKYLIAHFASYNAPTSPSPSSSPSAVSSPETVSKSVRSNETNNSTQKSSKLWNKFTKRVIKDYGKAPIDKGAKNILRRLESMKNSKSNAATPINKDKMSVEDNVMEKSAIVKEANELRGFDIKNEMNQEELQRIKDRENALFNARIGGSLLVTSALIRRIVFKI